MKSVPDAADVTTVQMLITDYLVTDLWPLASCSLPLPTAHCSLSSLADCLTARLLREGR